MALGLLRAQRDGSCQRAANCFGKMTKLTDQFVGMGFQPQKVKAIQFNLCPTKMDT